MPVSIDGRWRAFLELTAFTSAQIAPVEPSGSLERVAFLRYRFEMWDASWSAKGLSPFLSERARNRAPQILSYAAVMGAAMLVTPQGEVALFSGAALEVDIARIARAAQARCGSGVITSFGWQGLCVLALPVSMGWVLCVLCADRIAAGQVIERARRASAVLALALADTVGPSSGSGSGPASGGAPANVFAAQLPARKSPS